MSLNRKQYNLSELVLKKQWHWSWDCTNPNYTLFNIKTLDDHIIHIYVQKPSGPKNDSTNPAGGVVIVHNDTDTTTIGEPVNISTDKHNQLDDQVIKVGGLDVHITNGDVAVFNDGVLVAAPDDKVITMPSGGEGEISLAPLLTILGTLAGGGGGGGGDIVGGGVIPGGGGVIPGGGGGGGGGFLQAPADTP